MIIKNRVKVSYGSASGYVINPVRNRPYLNSSLSTRLFTVCGDSSSLGNLYSLSNANHFSQLQFLKITYKEQVYTGGFTRFNGTDRAANGAGRISAKQPNDDWPEQDVDRPRGLINHSNPASPFVLNRFIIHGVDKSLFKANNIMWFNAKGKTDYTSIPL